jgi:hypothetical protein
VTVGSEQEAIENDNGVPQRKVGEGLRESKVRISTGREYTAQDKL